MRRSMIVLALLAATIVGCDAPRDSESERCGGDPPLCYPLNSVRNWCYVEQVRDGVSAGRLSAEDLPAWVDLSKRKDGRPLIYDFTTTDPSEWAGWSDDLRNSVRQSGKTWDADAVKACSDDNEVEDVVRSEGAPRA